MRIALVSQEYPPETAHGGIGTQTRAKAHGLAALGHEVEVLSHSIDGEKREYLDGDVRITRIAGMDDRLPIYTEATRTLTYSAEVAAAVALLHAQSPLDIVDFPEWGSEGYIHLLNRTEWNYIPTVIHLQGPLVMFAHTIGWPELDSEFYRVGTMMEGTCLRLADAVFSSSDCSADWCAAHYGLAREQIPTLHTGVDTRLFRPRDVPEKKRPTIIFVGKIERNKGVMLLLEAGIKLAHKYPDLQLRMLGRGNQALIKEMYTKANAACLPALLDLPGFVEREELPAHLSRAHLFAAPSLFEGGPGFVYLEAMACGLPAVACSGSGAAEVVRHGENGMLIAPDDAEALVEAIDQLLSDPTERAAMGARARQSVLTTADSGDCLKKIESFYASVIVGRQSGLFPLPACQS